MSNETKVSVLMNCYNGEQYLNEAIDSVLNQTHKNLELVFWDNQSSDRSATIVQSYQDDRVRYFRSKQHTDLSQARQLAYEYLRGDWVAILDVDDAWEPCKLEKQLQRVKLNHDVGFIYCRTLAVDENGEALLDHLFTKHPSKLPKGDIYQLLVQGNYICVASLLINKSKLDALGGFSGKYPIMEDYFVSLNLAKNYPVEAVDELLCRYRIHGQNESLKCQQDTFEDLQIVKDLFPDRWAYLAALRILLRHIKKSLINRSGLNVKKAVKILWN